MQLLLSSTKSFKTIMRATVKSYSFCIDKCLLLQFHVFYNLLIVCNSLITTFSLLRKHDFYFIYLFVYFINALQHKC